MLPRPDDIPNLDSPPERPSEETILDVHERCEHLDARRRVGVWLMYSPLRALIVLLVGGMVSAFGNGTVGGGRSFGSTFQWWDLPLYVGLGAMLLTVVLCPIGILMRSAAALGMRRALKRLPRLPDWPPPLVGEPFGRHVVRACDEHQLVLERRDVRRHESARLTLGIASLIGLLALSSLFAFPAVASAGPSPILMAILAGFVTWSLSERAHRWAVVRPEGGGPGCFVIESRRFIRSRRVVELAAADVHGLHVRKASGPVTSHPMLFLHDRGKGRLALCQVGYGRLADWQVRRLTTAIALLLQDPVAAPDHGPD